MPPPPGPSCDRPRRAPIRSGSCCSPLVPELHADGSWHNAAVTPRAITVRPADPRDAQAIALMSRDFIEAGLSWKYDAPRVLRAIRDRETLAVVACEGGKSPGGSASSRGGVLTGFAIMEFGDERAHLVLLAMRPSHPRLSICQRLLEMLLQYDRCDRIANVHLELRAVNDA